MHYLFIRNANWHIFLGKGAMKNDQSPLIILLLLGAVLFYAFTRHDLPGEVRGSIKPYNGALHAWAISDIDTGNAVITSGTFNIKNLKPGKYRVVIEGLRPYKTTAKPDVLVNGGSATDVGEIVLDQ